MIFLFSGKTHDETWEAFGSFLIVYACETGWEKFLGCVAYNLQVIIYSFYF